MQTAHSISPAQLHLAKLPFSPDSFTDDCHKVALQYDRKPRRPTLIRVFTPLAEETRLTVDTETAAHHLSRRPATLRRWSMDGSWPTGLQPLRVNGRLAWPVKGLLQAGATA